ncbi:amidase [Paeniroseomonas aquatica]|uniref:Amidase n=1 Tax=Paeniroseomonas aquatica TaxID=373043 RepID=A0ABT8AAM6_9PROT|nr:amidase [Paeniroseomonas aquatica]MDN3566779.1 amidase [Paeniroseomonas aquatica]
MSAPPVPSLAEASAGIADGTLSPVALCEQALARIAALEPALNAFILLTADRARAAAATAEAEIKAGRSRGPLHGIPYALKDIYDVAGLPTTAHSRVLIGRNTPVADSDAAARLEAAGMVLLGKLATHEFARGGVRDDDLPFPRAKNPWNPLHFAGGSSSGSGAGVSSGMMALAMGSDTGGSIRLPAAFSGCVGLKPTYGRLSRRGVVPLSFGMDHTGPLTRTVEDCALAMQVLAGHDPEDPGSAPVPVGDYMSGLRDGVAGLRLGYARAYNIEAGVDAEALAANDAAVEVLAKLGAGIVEVAMPSLKRFEAAVWTIIHAESFAIHQQDLRQRPEAYGRTTRERIMLGAFVTGPQYVQAQRLRLSLMREVDALFGEVDAILCAPAHGAAPLAAESDDGPWRRAQPITAAFNVTGHPALCLPAGFAANGLPLSLQIVGRNFDEATVLRIGQAYEQATEWHTRRPPEAWA